MFRCVDSVRRINYFTNDEELNDKDTIRHFKSLAVIGGWENTQSIIRFCKECGFEPWLTVPTPDILNPDEYQHFFVSFESGMIQVGFVDRDFPFMVRKHDDIPHSVTHVGIVSGYGSSADWIFCGYGEEIFCGYGKL